MSFLDLSLFLGFPCDALFEKELELANPFFVTFLTSGGDYLEATYENQKKYLGKKLPPLVTLPELECFELHIISLLRRLAPHYSFNTHPLILLTVSIATTKSA